VQNAIHTLDFEVPELHIARLTLSKEGKAFVGLALDFRNLPENVLGIGPDVFSARVSLRQDERMT
jgi:hypothetical protein